MFVVFWILYGAIGGIVRARYTQNYPSVTFAATSGIVSGIILLQVAQNYGNLGTYANVYFVCVE